MMFETSTDELNCAWTNKHFYNNKFEKNAQLEAITKATIHNRLGEICGVSPDEYCYLEKSLADLPILFTLHTI